MKINIDETKSQADPYVEFYNGFYYMYASNADGVSLYKSKDMKNWDCLGFCYTNEKQWEFWAPCIYFENGTYYLYFSHRSPGDDDPHLERLSVATSTCPEGPFTFVKEFLPYFAIDPHVVKSGNELFIFYCINDYDSERAGTYIVVDKMKSPTELCGNPVPVVKPSMDEEIFQKDRFKKGQHWHTLEGAFYFREGDYHFVMYSGNCYQHELYFVGYAVAHGNETDLTKLDWKKYPDNNTYAPLLRKNDNEEGTGHNSVLFKDGKHYCFYHGRDYGRNIDINKDVRTARICEILVDKDKLKIINR